MKTAFVNVQATGSSLCGGASVSNDRTGAGDDASDLYPLGTTKVTFTLTDSHTPWMALSAQMMVTRSEPETPAPDLTLKLAGAGARAQPAGLLSLPT